MDVKLSRRELGDVAAILGCEIGVDEKNNLICVDGWLDPADILEAADYIRSKQSKLEL